MLCDTIRFFSKAIKSNAFTLTRDALGSPLKISEKLDMVCPFRADANKTIVRWAGLKSNAVLRWDPRKQLHYSGKSLAELVEEAAQPKKL